MAQSQPAPTGRRLVLLRPEDIRRRVHGQPIKDQVSVKEFSDNGVPAYVYSNGALEWALEHGYDVYVLTPQPNLRKEDDWWQVLLQSPDRIFKGLTSAQTPEELFHPWLELLRRLEIPFERIEHTGEARDLLRKNGVLFAEDLQAVRNA